MFAQRANVIVRKLVPFMHMSADGTNPALLLRLLRLRLDVALIVAIRTCRLIAQHLRFFKLCDKQRVAAQIRSANQLAGEIRIRVGLQAINPIFLLYKPSILLKPVFSQ